MAGGSENSALEKSGESADNSFSETSVDSGASSCSQEKKNFVTFDVTDALGNAEQGAYVLEHPDGTFEDGTLEQGLVHKEDVPEGKYTLHLPALSEASWAKEELPLTSETGAGDSIEIEVKHVAIRSGSVATFKVFYQFVDSAEDEPLDSFEKPLSGDDSKLGEEQQTKVSWTIKGLGTLIPGETKSLVFHVQVADCWVSGGAPLLVGYPEG